LLAEQAAAGAGGVARAAARRSGGVAVSASA
jgi:hypothetical protein